MNPIGRSRVEQETVDKSVLQIAGLQGITAVLGQTERGVIGKTELVGSWEEYQETFGGFLGGDDFPLLCKRALDRGGRLRVARVGGTGGVKATLNSWNANSEGTWGNYVVVSVVSASNGNQDQVDIVAKITNSDFIQNVNSVNKVLTEEDLVKIENSLSIVEYTGAVGDTLTVGDSQLAGGVDLTTVDTDYVSGVNYFDNDADFVKIAVPAKAVPDIDNKLLSYAESRKDCRAFTRTPIGITGTVAVDYRKRQGSFSGVEPDTYFGDMIFGGIKIKHPKTLRNVTISAIGDVIGIFGSKDSDGKQWFSGAGSKRGKIKAIGVDYNLATPARSAEFDLVDVNGINAVVDDVDFGVVLWGNSTLQKKKTLLSNSNVADLIVYLNRVISPYAKSELFDPNDTITWSAIFRKVNPVMRDLKKRRAFWDYKYDGDQFAQKVSDAVVNKPANIDAGQYIFYLYIQPKVGLKYVGIKVIVTNSGVKFKI